MSDFELTVSTPIIKGSRIPYREVMVDGFVYGRLLASLGSDGTAQAYSFSVSGTEGGSDFYVRTERRQGERVRDLLRRSIKAAEALIVDYRRRFRWNELTQDERDGIEIQRLEWLPVVASFAAGPDWKVGSPLSRIRLCFADYSGLVTHEIDEVINYALARGALVRDDEGLYRQGEGVAAFLRR